MNNTCTGGNGINLTGNTKVNNNLEVLGSVTIGGYTTVNDNMKIDGQLQVTNRINSNITSSGTSYFYTAQFGGDAIFNGTVKSGGYTGVTDSIVITDYFGLQRRFNFNKGIFTGMG